MALKLFDDEYFQVSYWAFEFDKNGNYIKTHLSKFTEIIANYRLPEFISMLKCIGSKNIQIKKAALLERPQNESIYHSLF